MENNKHDEYKVYLDERKQLIDSERKTAQQFDKGILTLAAGALALSITFINQIAPLPKADSMHWLIIAWSSLCLSLLSTLISFLTSQVACRKQRDILDAKIARKEESENNKAASWTNRLNYFSIAFFILGIIFIIVFASINLPRGGDKEMPQKKIDEGYVPPKPPVKPPVKPSEKPSTIKK